MRNSDPSGSSSHVAYTRWRRLSTTIFPAMSRFKTAGSYKVSLPWKEFHEPLPDNYHLTLKRLRGLLNQNREILKQYIWWHHSRSAEEGDYRARPSWGALLQWVHYLPRHAVYSAPRQGHYQLCMTHLPSQRAPHWMNAHIRVPVSTNSFSICCFNFICIKFSSPDIRRRKGIPDDCSRQLRPQHPTLHPGGWHLQGNSCVASILIHPSCLWRFVEPFLNLTQQII